MPAVARRPNPGLPLAGQMVPGQLPVRGINARDAAARMAPDDALDLINMLSDNYGVSMRGGYQEYAINLPGGLPVRTLMSYYPGTAPPSSVTMLKQSVTALYARLELRAIPVALNGQLFACTNGEIFDITAGGVGPWVPEAGIFATSDYWTWLNFQNAGGNFLLATNDEGLYVAFGEAGFSNGFSSGFATVSTGFSKIVFGVGAGQVSGVNPDLFVYIMVWKRRLWFIEKNSTRSWYLPVDQITGEARLFDFGPQFRHGGHLAALGNWTIDGGEGIDDYLVAVSSEGDVVIYKGFDPDSAATDPAAFQLHGIWYVGALPVGRRQISTYGGDLYILSTFGVSQVSKLVATSQVAANMIEDTSSRIDPYITRLMKVNHNASGWYVVFLPINQLMVLGVPQQITGEGVVQLVMTVRQTAWSKLLDLPMACMINHDALAFGGGDVANPVSGAGKVFLLFDNALDNVPLVGTTGSTIRGRVVPSYQPLGAPGMYKNFPMIRPTFSAPVVPTLKLTVLVDFSTPQFFSVPTLPIIQAALWDVDLWDVGLWAGTLPPIHKWLGTIGAGYAATVQMDLVGVGGTRLMSIDWWVVPGGPL